MIIVMLPDAAEAQVQSVIERLNGHGFDVHRSSGQRHTVLGAIGTKPAFDHLEIAVLPGVEAVFRVTPAASKPGVPEAKFGSGSIGGGRTAVWATLRDPSPAEVERLLGSQRRVSGIVYEAGRRFDDGRVREAACAARSMGRGLALAPFETIAQPVADIDAVILPSLQANHPDRIAPVADAGGLVVLRPPLAFGRWSEAIETVRSRGAEAALLVRPSRFGDSFDPGDVVHAKTNFGVPVLLDAARKGGSWNPSIPGAIATGACGVVLRGESAVWADPDRASGLAELAAVASAAGRPLASAPGGA